MKLKYWASAIIASQMLLVACEEDRDSNPVINSAESYAEFTLNTPALAENNTYVLENSESLVLTTSQPDFGFTASTLYTVLVSLDGKEFTALSTTYTTAQMAVSASEINNAILEMAGDADLSNPIALYVKLNACINEHEDLGVAESNVVKLPKVLAYVPVVEIELPSEIYMVGSFAAANSWSTFVPMHLAYSQEGFFYSVVYLANGDNFKFSLKAAWGTDWGYDGMGYDGDIASATTSSSDGNAVFGGESGWYTVIVKAKIANGSLQYTLSFLNANVYLIGACAGGEWSMSDAFKFTAPADASGNWVSPAFAGSGEVRMAIDCGIDWWKTEFTLDKDGNIYYRDIDIPANWAENKGEDYSISGSAATVVKLNFTAGTGTVE